jgi:hypothetical protein
MMWRYLLLLHLITAFLSCEPTATQVQPTFYHWKSTFAPGAYAGAVLDTLQTDRLYLRFFDIDWDAAGQQAIPVGDADLGDVADYGVRVIPSVFITNRTLQTMPSEAIPLLAQRLYRRILQKAKSAGLPVPSALQLDCDWTAGTRDAFFGLLDALRQEAGPQLELSATIRLHQLRDRDRMGIPPVDRGMLMFYNMGNLEQWPESNSILNLQKAEPYIGSISDYPVGLDLALPIYAWGLVFREEEFLMIINDLRPEALTDTSYFQKINTNRYRIRKSTYLEGNYVYQGDAIRIEEMTPSLVMAAVTTLQPYFKHKTFDLAFYHLDSTNLTVFDHATLQQICQQMEH